MVSNRVVRFISEMIYLWAAIAGARFVCEKIGALAVVLFYALTVLAAFFPTNLAGLSMHRWHYWRGLVWLGGLVGVVVSLLQLLEQRFAPLSWWQGLLFMIVVGIGGGIAVVAGTTLTAAVRRWLGYRDEE